MAEVVKETVVTERDNDIEEVTTQRRVEYIIYFIFGVLEVLLIFRLILRMLGANPGSSFVDFIYSFTNVFILPFEGIFSRGVTEGLETTAVFEPSTLVAIVVYALVSWGIVKLIRIFAGERDID